MRTQEQRKIDGLPLIWVACQAASSAYGGRSGSRRDLLLLALKYERKKRTQPALVPRLGSSRARARCTCSAGPDGSNEKPSHILLMAGNFPGGGARASAISVDQTTIDMTLSRFRYFWGKLRSCHSFRRSFPACSAIVNSGGRSSDSTCMALPVWVRMDFIATLCTPGRAYNIGHALRVLSRKKRC